MGLQVTQIHPSDTSLCCVFISFLLSCLLSPFLSLPLHLPSLSPCENIFWSPPRIPLSLPSPSHLLLLYLPISHCLLRICVDHNSRPRLRPRPRQFSLANHDSRATLSSAQRSPPSRFACSSCISRIALLSHLTISPSLSLTLPALSNHQIRLFFARPSRYRQPTATTTHKEKN